MDTDESHLAPESRTRSLRLFLGRRWRTIVAVAVPITAVAAILLLQQPPQYIASTPLVLPGDDAHVQALSQGFVPLEVIDEAIATSGIGTDPEQVRTDVDLRRDGDVLLAVATAGDPEVAARLADALAAATVDQRVQRLDTARQVARERLGARLSDLLSDQAGVEAQLQELDPGPVVDPATGLAPPDLPGVTTQVAGLLVQQRELVSLTTALQAELTAFDLEDVPPAGEVLRPAVVPTTPSSPDVLRGVAQAMLLGLVLGLALAFVRDRVHDAIRNERDVATSIGRPIVGRIPAWDADEDGRIVLASVPGGPASESFRMLRTNVRFLVEGPELGVVLISSPTAGDGKTTAAANFAVANALMGNRVVLIDADMRRPNVDQAFVLPRSPGLSEVLVGREDHIESLREVGVPNLRVLSAGATPPNPSELLSSPAMRQLLDEYRSLSHLVVVDAPPMLAVSDALGLSGLADIVLLVVRQGVTRQATARATREQLARLGVRIDGVVFNAITEAEGGHDHATYYEEYAEVPDPLGARFRDRLRD